MSSPRRQDSNDLEALLATLRALRLRHMAEELPGLLEEAQKDGWGQIDLIGEVFRREELRKRQRRFERNLKASGLSERYGLEHFNFEIGRDHGLDPQVVRDLAGCEFVRARRNLILAGRVGTGKTFLGRTLGAEALKRGYKVYSFNTAALVELLYSKRSSFQFGKLYARIRDVDLLLLDDLAYLPYAPEKVEFLFSLVVDRHELKTGSVIVTSNTDVTEWWQFFPSKAMGMAFSDRLLDGAQGIRLTGESIRHPRNVSKPNAQPIPPANAQGTGQAAPQQ
ncbi:MAG: ATP-binding protein [Planctomycetes bacterium]|nr:ATP-binding protein [Planctomycetota bacterium]